jgi:predicted nuclease of predicted toxin-antitoxin system
MGTFLLDEDMPRSTARLLRQAGHVADDVRDIGLRGQDDARVFGAAQERNAILVTADKGFGNLLAYPLGSHHGIIVVRVPDELPSSVIHRELLRALMHLDASDLAGPLVVVEIGRVRLRRR